MTRLLRLTKSWRINITPADYIVKKGTQELTVVSMQGMHSKTSVREPFGRLAQELGGVTQVLEHVGLQPAKKTPKLSRRSFSPHTVIAAVGSAVQQPHWGSVRAANDLSARGVHLNAREVQHIWSHYGLDQMAQRRQARVRTYESYVDLKAQTPRSRRASRRNEISSRSQMWLLSALLGLSLAVVAALITCYAAY